MATQDLPALGGLSNQSVVDQQIAAATTALLTGSTLAIPPSMLRVGSIFRFSLSVSKTAAGTAGNIFLIKLGTLGTATDPTILTFTLPTGTAVVDTAWIEILVTIRGPLTASCIARGQLALAHNLAATGFAIIPSVVLQATSAAFNATVSNLIISASCTTATSTVLTFSQVIAEGWNV
jgi:hypothetical protein